MAVSICTTVVYISLNLEIKIQVGGGGGSGDTWLTVVMGIPALFRESSLVLVHSKEPALPAPKRLFQLSNTFFE